MENMELRLLTVFLPVAICQIKPDVTFDENNDRFDLTPIIQEGYMDQWGDVMDGVRRSNRLSRRNDDTEISEATSKFMEALKGFQRNFNFNSPDGLENEDPEEKVQLRRDLVSYLHENRPDDLTRRSGKTESEIDREVLMHHAVPVVMKVEGFMQLPLHRSD